MYVNGRGVARDDSVAVFWMRKAFDNGIPQAANVLQLVSATIGDPKLSCIDAPVTIARASKEMEKRVVTKAREAGLDPKLVMAVISAESGFDPNAVSRKNARGLMQLTDQTAARFKVQDPFSIDQNLRGGITFLARLMKRFHGDVVLALAAYNAGEGAIDEWGGVPPYQETKEYVSRVQAMCGCFSLFSGRQGVEAKNN
jgi:soluble lytic murein transglycosylase-like protein